LFLGTTNDYYGLGIFRAKEDAARRPKAPDRLEVEPTDGGSALLSWGALPADRHCTCTTTKNVFRRFVTVHRHVFEIWRAPLKPILIRDDPNYIGWNAQTGNKVPDTYIGPYERIAVTSELRYVDSTVQTGQRYMYYVVQAEECDKKSEASNLVTFPLLAPAATFAQLLSEVDRSEQRQRWLDPILKLTLLRSVIMAAQSLAAGCQLDQAAMTLAQQNPESSVQQPEATDLEVLIAKLTRRLALFKQLPGQVLSDEFCR
jgi:hypothetical protein